MSIVVTTQDELDAAAKADADDIIIDSPAGVWLRVGGDTRIAGVRGASCVGPVGDSATVSGVGGSATVRDVGGSATVSGVGGSATVSGVGGSATVSGVGGSATVRGVGGSATVRGVGGSATVSGVRGSATVSDVGDSATVSGVGGSATVSDVGDSATVRDVGGSATVHLYGSATAQHIGSHVAVHLHSGAVKVTGGVIIDHTGVSDFEGAQWAAYHALADADGHAVVYKAVSPELEAGQSHRLTAYPIGETVAAPDWDPRKACGNGLHFSPTPRQALRYYQGPDSTKARYLACRVVLDTLVPLDDKCKAPSCEVLHEVTIDGEAVTA